ncbi:hypothetical protein BTRA_5562 [Burkholderia thailandensis USAMRU Malaysia |nr:hypothetical protein BTQ_3803 [Burkholderia thailandensis 2002721723]AHI81720.1 hypothetical protein BTJ_4834 [Burkholderia thailandensis E444]AIC91068.1 hypothetical protein BTRA_5562 [Burkholderia thailandensis USAMRU Malaysia \
MAGFVPPVAFRMFGRRMRERLPRRFEHIASRTGDARRLPDATRAHPIHLETILDPAERRLKVVIAASAGDAAALLGTLDMLAGSFAR